MNVLNTQDIYKLAKMNRMAVSGPTVVIFTSLRLVQITSGEHSDLVLFKNWTSVTSDIARAHISDVRSQIGQLLKSDKVYLLFVRFEIGHLRRPISKSCVETAS